MDALAPFPYPPLAKAAGELKKPAVGAFNRVPPSEEPTVSNDRIKIINSG
jgi:hypothetical protein